RADGSEFPVELTVGRISGADPPMFTGYLRDITERRRSETDREIALERERAERGRAELAQEHARRLAVEVLEAEERERVRLSQALHDESVQNLLVALQDLR